MLGKLHQTLRRFYRRVHRAKRSSLERLTYTLLCRRQPRGRPKQRLLDALHLTLNTTSMQSLGKGSDKILGMRTLLNGAGGEEQEEKCSNGHSDVLCVGPLAVYSSHFVST